MRAAPTRALGGPLLGPRQADPGSRHRARVERELAQPRADRAAGTPCWRGAAAHDMRQADRDHQGRRAAMALLRRGQPSRFAALAGGHARLPGGLTPQPRYGSARGVAELAPRRPIGTAPAAGIAGPSLPARFRHRRRRRAARPAAVRRRRGRSRRWLVRGRLSFGLLGLRPRRGRRRRRFLPRWGGWSVPACSEEGSGAVGARGEGSTRGPRRRRPCRTPPRGARGSRSTRS